MRIATALCLFAATASALHAGLPVAVKDPTPKPISLGVKTSVTLNQGDVAAFYVDIPPGAGKYLAASVSLASKDNIGYAQIQLERGDGTLLTVQDPQSSSYDEFAAVTSETAPGDQSGRWYVTATNCDGCTGAATQSTFDVLVQLEDFAATRSLTMNTSTPISARVGSTLQYMLDLGAVPGDVTARRLQVEVASNNASSPDIVLLQMQLEHPVASPDASDVPGLVQYGSPAASNCYGSGQFVRTTQFGDVAFGTNTGGGLWFVSVTVCNGCTGEADSDMFVGTLTPTFVDWTPATAQLTPTSVFQPTLSDSAPDYFFADVNATSFTNGLIISVTNSTANAFFKVVARKGAFPTLDKNDVSAPSDDNYDSHVSLDVTPDAVDPAGRWYFGVYLYPGCSGYVLKAPYTIKAIAT